MDGNLQRYDYIAYQQEHDFEPEEWKDVPSYEGKYQVSTYGNVKSLDRTTLSSNGKLIPIKGSDLKHNKCKAGYLNVYLYKNRKSRKFFGIHQLVAMAFLNHKPCGHKIIVDHEDENKQNNYLYNLRLTTNRINCSKSKKNKTSKFTGVHWDKERNKWVSQIFINGKTKNLGRFECELAAARAYQNELGFNG